MTEIEVQDIVLQQEPDKNITILNDYLFNGLTQAQIANKYDISQQAVSQRVRRVLNDESIKSKLVSGWEKEYSITARAKALDLVKSLDVSKIPDSSKAMSSGILVDKARLIDSETTENIGVHVVSERVESRRKRLEELYREQGMDTSE